MKNQLLLGLVLLTVAVMLYAGIDGMIRNHTYGLFFTFVGGLTTIGLGLDIVNHLRQEVRKQNVRKLGRG